MGFALFSSNKKTSYLNFRGLTRKNPTADFSFLSNINQVYEKSLNKHRLTLVKFVK
jgi:hypothetical protein